MTEHVERDAAWRRILRAAQKRRTAESEYRAAIVAAREAGLSLRDIGEAAGISHVRVLNILRDEKR